MREVDIEDLANKYQNVLSREYPKPSPEDITKFTPIITTILASPVPLNDKELTQIKRRYKCNHKRSFLYQIFLALKPDLINTNQLTPESEAILRKSLQIKPYKSWSGIVSVTIFTAAYPEYTDPITNQRVKQSFSCQYNCFMCPKEPNQPRSYLSLEPAVIRAAKNNYDALSQIHDRLNTLYMTGHDISKIEIIVSGGTWTSYPKPYREEFCRDIYYAVNTFNASDSRPRLTLAEEKLINQTAELRVVGLTIETRPDTITPDELKLLRFYGVTRVQLGIQHTNDEILNIINRRCPTATTIKAIKLLKDACFKIDAHWMLNLPTATPEEDDKLLNQTLLGVNSPTTTKTICHPRTWSEFFYLKSRQQQQVKEIHEHYDITSPDLSTDSWKIYPCAVTPWTQIESWFKEGRYKPYSADLMQPIIIKAMTNMYPWIRVSRIIRDIPTEYMFNENTGADNTNMRQTIDQHLKIHNIHSMDIRNREVKDQEWDGNYIIVIRHYKASGGDEYFISAESSDKRTLYGFLRLRLPPSPHYTYPFKEFATHPTALIRELHVYGDLTKVGTRTPSHVQHRGIGRTLVKRAEELAKPLYTQIAVIAAEGNKEYYRKLGFTDSDNFMIKPL